MKGKGKGFSPLKHQVEQIGQEHGAVESIMLALLCDTSSSSVRAI